MYITTEPVVESSPLLMGNIRRNNCEDKVITLNIVTSNEMGCWSYTSQIVLTLV
jgi:hypothetical protein